MSSLVSMALMLVLACSTGHEHHCEDDTCRLEAFWAGLATAPDDAIDELEAIDDPILVTSAIMNLIEHPEYELRTSQTNRLCDAMPGESNAAYCRRRLSAAHLRPLPMPQDDRRSPGGVR